MVKFRRIATILVGVAFIGFSIASNMGLSSMKKPPSQAYEKHKTPLVKVIQVKNNDIRVSLQVNGKLVAAKKIDLFAEVSGVMLPTAQNFKAGSFYKQGELLLNLDDTEAKATLTAQKSELLSALVQILPDLKIDFPDNASKWEYYIAQFDINKNIAAFPEPASQKEKFFITSRKLYNLYFNIKSLELRAMKYKVQAPFDGVLTQATIQTGTLVNMGQRLGEFVSKGNYELEVSLRPKDLQLVSVGTSISLNSTNLAGVWTGRVARINEAIDPSTQTIKAYIKVSGQTLKQGMYLSGELLTKAQENAFEMDRSLLREDSTVAVVVKGQLQFEKVNVAVVSAKTVIVKGLKENTHLIASPTGVMKAGTQVKVVE